MKKLLLLLSTGISLFATTSIVSITPSATQAIIVVKTNQSGNCTYRASEGSSLSTMVNDVNTTLYPGLNTDARAGSLPGSSISTVQSLHTFVLGGRYTTQSSYDNNNYGHPLQAFTQHITGVTCGSDSEVTQLFVTINPSSGVSYREPQFNRASPGDYSFPSIPWHTRNAEIIDPETGTMFKLAVLPGDVVPLPSGNQAQTIVTGSVVSGTNWSGSNPTWNYSGTSQGTLFLPITPLSTSDGSLPFSSSYTSGPTWIEFLATLSGTAGNVDVCLSINYGQSCIGKTIVQAITSTPTVYTVGSTVVVQDVWKSGPRPPIAERDLVPQTGTVTKSGTAVTWSGQNHFLPLNWVSGTPITINGSGCLISSVQTDKTLTLQSSGCVSDGTFLNYSVPTQFGFIIKADTSASGTIAVTSPSWKLGTAGYTPMPDQGYTTDICQAIASTGPGSVQGNMCAVGGVYGPPHNYNTSDVMLWIGQDGSSNVVGMMSSTTSPSGFTIGYCGAGGYGIVTDPLHAGGWFCQSPYVSGGGKEGLFELTYTGTYAAIGTPPTFDDNIPGSPTISVLTNDINTAVNTFDTTGNYAAYVTQQGGNPGWQIMGWADNGGSGNGVLLLQTQHQQEYPGWFSVFSLDSKTIIGLMCTYCGAPGDLNRWVGNHSGFATRYYNEVIFTSYIVTGGGYTVSSTGTLGAAPWTTCNTNSFGASGANCSTISVSSLTPLDGGGNGLALASGNAQLQLGDYVGIPATDSYYECARIINITGLNLELFRHQYSNFSVCGGSTAHNANQALQTDNAKNEYVWNWKQNPTGANVTVDPDTSDCHYEFSLDTFLLGCTAINYAQGKPFRLGPFPANITNPVSVINFDAGFGNSWATYVGPNDNNMQTHPSQTQIAVNGAEQNHFIDNRPYFGFGIPSSGVTLVGGKTYTYLVPSASLPNYNYRVHSWAAFSGDKPLVDVSGPSAVLGDTSADWYKFCHVLIANECVSGSTAGQTYVNAPYVSSLNAVSCGGGTSSTPPVNDISIDEWYPGMSGIQEIATDRGNDPIGRGVRLLTSAFSRKCSQSIFWNSREMALGTWVLTNVDNLDGTTAAAILIKKPPTPITTSQNLADFIQYVFNMGGGTTGDTVKIQYGYAEYDQGQLATGAVPPCNPRNEGCFTDGSGANPYVWASETQHATACSSGCNVTMNVLPAPGGRVVYFKRIRINGANTNTGPLEVMMVGN